MLTFEIALDRYTDTIELIDVYADGLESQRIQSDIELAIGRYYSVDGTPLVFPPWQTHEDLSYTLSEVIFEIGVDIEDDAEIIGFTDEIAQITTYEELLEEYVLDNYGVYGDSIDTEIFADVLQRYKDKFIEVFESIIDEEIVGYNDEGIYEDADSFTEAVIEAAHCRALDYLYCDEDELYEWAFDRYTSYVEDKFCRKILINVCVGNHKGTHSNHYFEIESVEDIASALEWGLQQFRWPVDGLHISVEDTGETFGDFDDQIDADEVAVIIAADLLDDVDPEAVKAAQRSEARRLFNQFRHQLTAITSCNRDIILALDMLDREFS